MTDIARPPAAPRASGPTFFQSMGLAAIAAALIGFAGTYFVPMAQGRFDAPAIVHLHGATALAWLILFYVQATTIRRRRHALHRRLGPAGALLALGLAASGIATAVHATRRDVAAGGGETAVSSLVGTCTSMALFVALVAAGILLRRRPAAHKRLMLLATILVLWPAWFRFRHFFPAVPRPDLVFGILLADSLILIAMIWDRRRFGRIHPALLWPGLALFAEHLAEAALFDTPPWRVAAHWLYALLT